MKDQEDKTLHAYDAPYWWYDIRGYFILRLSYQTTLFSLIKFFYKNMGKNHLEAAIGSGTFFQYVLFYRRWKKLKMPISIAAFDYSDVMLLGAKKRFKNYPNIEITQCDVLHLPYEDNAFDTINVANAMHCFHDIDDALRELYRVLKPGGTMATNVLLYPSGNKLFRLIANKLNAWGMKKGILLTPYEKEKIRNEIIKIGFVVTNESLFSNSYHILVKKPALLADSNSGSSPNKFQFDLAFDRNIGWLTRDEMHALKEKRVCIAGLGGVGGIYLLTLARLGIGKFNISDMDSFELANFNRQVGATMSSIGKKKVDVLENMAKDVNPELDIKVFPEGINEINIDDFLKGADLFVDGIDFFSLELRSLIFERCYQLGIPAISSAPSGMGVSTLIFMPGKMSFSEYFNLDNKSYEDKYIYFIIGFNPTLSNRKYLVVKDVIDFKNQRFPSTIIGCELCASVTAAEALKILLKRGKVYSAPYYHLFDAYLNIHKIGWLPWGNKNPLQKLKYFIIKKFFLKEK